MEPHLRGSVETRMTETRMKLIKQICGYTVIHGVCEGSVEVVSGILC